MTSRLITRFRGLHIPQRPFHQSVLQFNEVRRDFQRQSKFQRRSQYRPPTQVTENLTIEEINRIRTVPTLNTFYGGNPIHEDNVNKLKALLKKYQSLPTRSVPDKEIKNQKFIGFDDYTKITKSGTRVKNIHYRELITLLNRLRSIDLQLMPIEVSKVLKEYSSSSLNKIVQVAKEKTLDSFGRARGKAKRKLCEAKVYLVKGEGEVLVNGKSIIEYFPNIYARKNIVYPFQVIDQEGKYNVFAQVSGGGYTGQSEAIMYAISKALVIFNPLLKPRLSKAGLMKSDSRIVERKKPGKLKARKSPTWVKR